jgi:hypothetical protein
MKRFSVNRVRKLHNPTQLHEVGPVQQTPHVNGVTPGDLPDAAACMLNTLHIVAGWLHPLRFELLV